MKPVEKLTDKELEDQGIGLVRYLGIYAWRSDAELQQARSRLAELASERKSETGQ